MNAKMLEKQECQHDTTYEGIEREVKCAMCHKVLSIPAALIRSCNCNRLAAEVERLKNELKASEFFLNEKREIIDSMKREYEELEFDRDELQKSVSGVVNDRNACEHEITRLKSYFVRVQELLTPVLLDPEGYVSIHGSDADKEYVQKAIEIINREAR